jgi:hypothetical protein
MMLPWHLLLHAHAVARHVGQQDPDAHILQAGSAVGAAVSAIYRFQHSWMLHMWHMAHDTWGSPDSCQDAQSEQQLTLCGALPVLP